MKKNETPVAWLSSGGALMLDRHIQGLTQDLFQTIDESPDALGRMYQGRYFLCESVDEEAAKRIARALGFEWSNEPVEEPDLAVVRIYGHKYSGADLLVGKLRTEAELRKRRVLVAEDLNNGDTLARDAKAKGYNLLILTSTFPGEGSTQCYVKIESNSSYYTRLLAL